MQNKKIIIIGDGGHAKIVIDIIHQMNCFNIVGVTSITLEKGSNFLGYPVLGNDDILKSFSTNENLIAMGIGGYRDNTLRMNVYEKIKVLGFKFANIIHPSSIISETAILGEALVIFPGVVINTEVEIGNNSIIATASTIDHESKIGKNVLISAGVTIGANSIIMDNVLIALGAKVISNVRVGPNALIAAGAVVVSDILEKEKVFGIPARSKEHKL